jgi:hypothetical protein
MNERRRGLEKVNASVEPAKDGRRPQLALEASNIRTGSGRRGSGVDMCSKEKRVNMGSPPWREERSQPEIREEQAGLRRVAERSVVAMKRVMIVERRDLSSRATSEVQKGIAIGHRPTSNLVGLLATRLTVECFPLAGCSVDFRLVLLGNRVFTPSRDERIRWKIWHHVQPHSLR